MKAQEAVRLAWQHHTIIPAFNIPYLPMVEPVVQAIVDENSVAMVQVARLEWEKFESQSPEAVAKEYFRFCKEGYTLLHLDHIPAIDEDQKNVQSCHALASPRKVLTFVFFCDILFVQWFSRLLPWKLERFEVAASGRSFFAPSA